MGVVLNVDDDSGMFKLGTKSGILEHSYARNTFTVLQEKFLSSADVPIGSVSLRKAAIADSIGPGIGGVHCNCTGMCENGKCKCFGMKIKCNSKCHKSKTCGNKHDD